jgi:hypothetical protein
MAETLPSFLTEKFGSAPAAPAPETVKPSPKSNPKPRIVDVPQEADPETLEVAPSALSKSARLASLTPEQRRDLRPLLAQLTALRDQMSGAPKAPR